MFSFVKKKENQEPERLTAFLDGKVIPIAEVPDQVFSAGIMGDGVAIEPENYVVTAPAAAEVTAVMEDSRHALGLKFANGVECLIHVGLDTVDMKSGDQVEHHFFLPGIDRLTDNIYPADPFCTDSCNPGSDLPQCFLHTCLFWLYSDLNFCIHISDK